jgi:hypothetical protein
MAKMRSTSEKVLRVKLKVIQHFPALKDQSLAARTGQTPSRAKVQGEFHGRDARATRSAGSKISRP